MDVSDLRASKLAAAKKHYPSQQNSHHGGRRSLMDDLETEEELRPDFPRPYCYEDHDIVSLCCHLAEDHPPAESKPSVCPICSIKVPRDMLNHIMLQHSYMLRHWMHRVAISSSQTLSILGYELGDSYLPVLGGGGGGGYQLSAIHNASGASSSLNDAFLSTLLLNVASPETEVVSKAIVPSLDDCLRKSSTSSHLWKLRIDSSTSSEEREVKVRQATVRASFVQDLLLCTLFE